MAEADPGAAFADVARPVLPRLYALARRLVDADAEDLVQECLLKAYRSYSALRDPAAAPKWFSTILVNCARDRYRHAQRLPAESSIDHEDDFSLFRTIAEWDLFERQLWDYAVANDLLKQPAAVMEAAT